MKKVCLKKMQNFAILFYFEILGGTRVGDIYIPPPVQPHCSSVSKGLPRLIITNIIIENFKSYAGKVTLGPFDHVSFF